MANLMYDTSVTQTTGSTAAGSGISWGGILDNLFSIGNTVVGGILAKDVAEENRRAANELQEWQLRQQQAITERQVATQGNPTIAKNNMLLILAVAGIALVILLFRR